MQAIKFVLTLFILATTVYAEKPATLFKMEALQYRSGATELKGFVAIPTLLPSGGAPAIIIFSDWMGVGDFAKLRAERLAKSGYIALVADVYGDGKHASGAAEAGELATHYKSDRTLLRERAKAAFEAMQKIEGVDKNKISAIGFCFGGTSALELARSGAALRGVVSFHGGLETPDLSLAKNIRAKLLILHGADDPYVPEAEVVKFEQEMHAAAIDYKLVKYPGAVHAFTNPEAGNDPTKGAAYNSAADQLSYGEMEKFFKIIN